jgi:FkbM family methyltransferase
MAASGHAMPDMRDTGAEGAYMPTTILPNALRVASFSAVETRFIYHEIFQAHTYMRHGIGVTDGACIFDVGANIGLYTLFVAQSSRNLTIFAFEPIPALFALLQENVSRHVVDSTVHLLRCGLSARNATAIFEVDKRQSLTSTMRAKDVSGSVRKDAAIQDWIRAVILDQRRVAQLPEGVARFLLWAMTVPVLNAAMALMAILGNVWLTLRKPLFVRHISCPVYTISHVMRQHNVTCIDLLKIDVEGSELDVISGIEEDDWPKIKQVVVEVHDVAGRLDTMRTLFERHGYRTIVEPGDLELLKLNGVWTLFAVRE